MNAGPDTVTSFLYVSFLNATLSTATTVFDNKSTFGPMTTFSVAPNGGNGLVYYGQRQESNAIDGGGHDSDNALRVEDMYAMKGFSFEKTIYLYVWGFLIILTTIANVLVIIVLARRQMRNATNTILIAIAISDSLTGLVTLPTYIHAYGIYIDFPNKQGLLGEHGVIELSESWCEGFMVIRYFVSRAFHTISIWLTVMLGVQRYVLVSFPFRAKSLFSVRNTCIFIVIIAVISPLVHVYKIVNRKANAVSHECRWVMEKNCDGDGCTYLWLTILLVHFIPCVLLVVFTGIMIFSLLRSTANVKRSQMVSNPKKLHKRDFENRRISFVVIVIVAVFLIPEIPYGIFLAVSLLLHQSGQDLLDITTNRQLVCAYEVLLVFTFHANIWIYFILNRRFRRGLTHVIDPVVFGLFRCVNSVLPCRRHQTESRLEGKSYPQNDAMSHPAVSRSNSVITERPHNSATGTTSNTPAILQMKTYDFKAGSDSCVESNGRFN